MLIFRRWRHLFVVHAVPCVELQSSLRKGVSAWGLQGPWRRHPLLYARWHFEEEDSKENGIFWKKRDTRNGCEYSGNFSFATKKAGRLNEFPEYLFAIPALTKVQQAFLELRRESPDLAPIDALFSFRDIIPAGIFNMGRSAENGHDEYYAERFSNEAYIADIEIPALSMGVTPVTQLQYYAVTGTNPSFFNDLKHCPNEWMQIGRTALCPSHPVEQVSYDDIVGRFLPALNAQSPSFEYCLPSEAQWELSS